MTAKEFVGRVLYYVSRPAIHLFLRGTRRAYVVLQFDDKILVVKNTLGSGKWHLPGGGCHKHESFEQGAIRELREEVGVAASESDLIRLSDEIFNSKRKFDYQLFLLRMPEPVELKIDQLEILEASWLDLGNFTDSNAGESTLQAVASLRSAPQGR